MRGRVRPIDRCAVDVPVVAAVTVIMRVIGGGCRSGQRVVVEENVGLEAVHEPGQRQNHRERDGAGKAKGSIRAIHENQRLGTLKRTHERG